MMILDKDGTPVWDCLTQEILKNNYSDIFIRMEYRHPNKFIAWIKRRNRWLWAYAQDDLIKAISNLLYTLHKNEIQYAGTIPVNPDRSIYFDAEETIRDPFAERMIEKHGKMFDIKLRGKDNKLIISEIVKPNGVILRAAGETVIKSCDNLFKETYAKFINIRKNLPEL